MYPGAGPGSLWSPYAQTLSHILALASRVFRRGGARGKVARINIDDDFFEDAAAVGARMGSIDLAVGQAMRLIRWAQLQIKAGKETTLGEFQRKGFSDHLLPEFGHLNGELVEVRGAKKHFKWLQTKKTAGAKGGKSKSEAKLRNLKQNRSKTEAEPKQKVAKPKCTEGSSSFSSSFSNSSTISSLNTIAPAPRSPKGSEVVAYYCDQWKEKNGKNPDVGGKAAGQLQTLVKDHGLPRAKELIRIYFAMPDATFIRRGYDVGTLLLSINAVGQFEANGKIVTAEAVKQIEKQVDKIQGTKRRRSTEELEAERDAQSSLRLIGDGT